MLLTSGSFLQLLRSGVHVLDSPALPARPGRKGEYEIANL